MGIFRTGYFPSAEPETETPLLSDPTIARAAVRGSIEGCGVQNSEAKRRRQGRIKLDYLDMGACSLRISGRILSCSLLI